MRDPRATRSGVVGIVLCLLVLGADEIQRPQPEQRRDVGLVERTERGLVQIDVSVRGPWEAIRDLGAED